MMRRVDKSRAPEMSPTDALLTQPAARGVRRRSPVLTPRRRLEIQRWGGGLALFSASFITQETLTLLLWQLLLCFTAALSAEDMQGSGLFWSGCKEKKLFFAIKIFLFTCEKYTASSLVRA